MSFLPRDEWLQVVEKAVLVSIDLILRRREDGRVLVGLRTNEPARGCWFVPGGCVRKGERLDDAYRRISAAELGDTLERRNSRLVGAFDHWYDTNFALKEGVSTQYVCLAHVAEVDGPRARKWQVDEQHSQWRWLTVEELGSLPEVHPNTRAYAAYLSY
eukprot:m51a1_g4828 hypothetical protein (159) ;mRNA; f:182243-182872